MPQFIPGTAGNHDATTSHFATQLTGNNTGEAIGVNQPVELRANGRLYRTSLGSGGVFIGVSPRPATRANQPLTVHGLGQRFHASDEGTLVPGAKYFLGSAAGTISDAATTRDSEGAFVAVSVHDLMVVRIGQYAGPQ